MHSGSRYASLSQPTTCLKLEHELMLLLLFQFWFYALTFSLISWRELTFKLALLTDFFWF